MSTLLRGRLAGALTIVACAIALVLPSAAYAYFVTNYVTSADFKYGDYGSTCCNKVREYNKVWRPIGYDISLFYDPSPCCAVRNWDQNPFTDPRNASWARAGCQNVDAFGREEYPVTCQTTYT